MKKNDFILILLISFIFLVLLNPSICILSIKNSYNLCMNKLFPSIIPFLLISNILIIYGMSDMCAHFFGKLIKKSFKTNINGAFVFIMSFLTGSPSSAKYIKDLYDNKIINDNSVNKIILFTHFISPIFLMTTVGLNTFGNKKIGLLMIITMLITNIIVGILFRNYLNIDKSNKIISINNSNNFIKILNESILKTVKTLIQIIGIITFISLIINLLFTYIDVNNNIKFLIIGLTEITQGINIINDTSFSYLSKILLITFICNFGGLSIHAQNFSIIDNKKIRYLPYLLSRIIAAFISVIIMYIFLIYHIN